MFQPRSRFPKSIFSRSVLSWLFATVWAVLLVILSTIFRQNIEELSTQYGVNDLFKNGVDLIVSTSGSTYIVWLFWLVTGVTVTLWIDAAIRDWIAKKKATEERDKLSLQQPSRLWGRVIYSTKTGAMQRSDSIIVGVEAEKIEPTIDDIGYLHTGQKRLKITVEFKRPINDAAVIVIGEQRDIGWRPNKIGKTYAQIEIRGSIDNYDFVIEVAENASDNERFNAEKWYKPITPQVAHTPPVLRQSIEEEMSK